MKGKQTQPWRVGSWRTWGVWQDTISSYSLRFCPSGSFYLWHIPLPQQLGHLTFIASGDKWHSGIQKSMLGFWFSKAWSHGGTKGLRAKTKDLDVWWVREGSLPDEVMLPLMGEGRVRGGEADVCCILSRLNPEGQWLCTPLTKSGNWKAEAACAHLFRQSPGEWYDAGSQH